MANLINQGLERGRGIEPRCAGGTSGVALDTPAYAEPLAFRAFLGFPVAGFSAAGLLAAPAAIWS